MDVSAMLSSCSSMMYTLRASCEITVCHPCSSLRDVYRAIFAKIPVLIAHRRDRVSDHTGIDAFLLEKIQTFWILRRQHTAIPDVLSRVYDKTPLRQNPLYGVKFRTALNISKSKSSVYIFKYACTERCHKRSV